MLNLFYITNHPEIAKISEKYGVDRIWIDLETLGKEERQKGMNTVKSQHTVADIPTVKAVLKKSEMLVRVNPWNEQSILEINNVIDAGADIVMLPMWKTPEEVQRFLATVRGRVKTTLLLETREAVDCIDDILKMDFDEIHIGLNDLHISYGMTFLFEPLADGTVDRLCEKFKKRGIPYGFGGVARLGEGKIPSEMIIREHYRLGSTRAILSRSFCNANMLTDIGEIDSLFGENMKKLRDFEAVCASVDERILTENHEAVVRLVPDIIKKLKEQKDA